jgi:glycosyltransferase involved in cell wall biosynthesis
MRICLLLPSFLPDIGGLEKAADRLARELVRRGHEVVILTRALEASQIAVERSFPIRYYTRPASPTWWPYSLEHALAGAHREFAFEIICAYHPYPPGYCAVRFGRRHSVPTVISCRGGDIGARSRYLKRWISRRRTIWSLRQADAVHVLSEDLCERVAALTGGRTGSHVIHNGTDLMDSGPPAGPMPAAAQPLQGRPFLLTLGRLRRFKGLHVLLEALAILRREQGDLPLVAIAGDGPERAALAEQVRAAGLTDHVRFLGDVLGQDKAWLLANCLFFVHPSLGGEGMPNAVLEALSYGKPIVATRIGGVTDLIHDGAGGVLVDPDRAETLAGAIRQMLAADLAQYGRDAETVARDHAWDKIAEEYLELFESVTRLRPALARSADSA